jgi:hypothetical protein
MKIGTIFQDEKATLRVEISNSCKNCFYSPEGGERCKKSLKITDHCQPGHRVDNKRVAYVVINPN